MTSHFSVRTIPQFDRLLRRLNRQHPELATVYADALSILRSDPYNRSRAHEIRWVRIGTSLTNTDGSEDLVLYALPVNARLQLRTPKAKEAHEE